MYIKEGLFELAKSSNYVSKFITKKNCLGLLLNQLQEQEISEINNLEIDPYNNFTNFFDDNVEENLNIFNNDNGNFPNLLLPNFEEPIEELDITTVEDQEIFNISDNITKEDLFRLIENGQDISSFINRDNVNLTKPDELRKTLLIAAIRAYNKPAIETLVNQGANVNQADARGNRPLHVAVLNNNLEVVNFLLDNGAKVNIQNFQRGPLGLDTPLHIAVRDNDIEIVKSLLEKEPNLNIRNEQNKTALRIAIDKSRALYDIEEKQKNQAIIELLEQAGNKSRKNLEPMPMDILTEYEEFIPTEEEQGIINKEELEELFELIELERERDISSVIDKWDSNSINPETGDTLLIAAIKAGNNKAVDNLIKNGASINKENYKTRETPLYAAAISGNIDAAKLLLDEDVSINKKATSGNTALHGAALKDDLPMVNLLLEKGADVNIQNDARRESWGKNTPLHIATRKGDLDIIQALLEKNPDLTIENNQNKTALDIAKDKSRALYNIEKQQKNKAIIELLKEAQNKLINQESRVIDNDISPEKEEELLKLIELGKDIKEELFKLIKSGKDISKFITRENANSINNNGETLLIAAIKSHNNIAVEDLIEKGASINKKVNYKTPLYEAAISNNIEAAKLLLDNGAKIDSKSVNGNTPLHGAVLYNHLDMVNFLLGKNANVNKINNIQEEESGRETPLHIAVRNKYTDIVQALLKSKPILDITNYKNQTALDVAIEQESEDIVKLLKEAKERPSNQAPIDIEETDRNISPDKVKELYELIKSDKNIDKELLELIKEGKDISKFITEENANPIRINRKSDNLLITAISSHNNKTVEDLLEKGADPNQKNRNDYTPLYTAAVNKNIKAAELLLSHNAKIDKRSNRGNTPLHGATLSDNLEIVNLLLENNANVDAQNYKKTETRKGSKLLSGGDTPLHIAIRKNNYHIVEALLEKNPDITITNNKGETAIDIAKSKKKPNKKIIKLLEEYISKNQPQEDIEASSTQTKKTNVNKNKRSRKRLREDSEEQEERPSKKPKLS